MIERFRERAKLIRPLIIPFIVYAGFLLFSTTWLEANPESRWRIPVALLPMIPGIVIAFGMVRAILQLDEMQRKIMLEGTAISFAGTLILVLSLGLLSIAGIDPPNGVYLGLAMVVMWFVGKLWATRRYQ